MNCDDTQTRVAVRICADYDVASVTNVLRDLLAPWGGMAAFVHPGDRVLIKPNFITATPADSAVITHPAVILAVAALIKAAGGRPVVGDSSPLVSNRRVAQRCGLLAYPEARDLEVIELKRRTRVPAVSPGPRRFFTFGLDPKAFDVIINVPKLKAHGQVVMTGAVKNMFGLIKGRGKAWLHFAHTNKGEDEFLEMLLQCCATAAPALTILDAVSALGTWGPTSGVPHPIGLLLAGTDPVAVDRIACDAARVDPKAIPLLRTAEAMGLRRRREAILLDGPDPLDLDISPMPMPDHIHPIRFDLPHIIDGFYRLARHRLAAWWRSDG